MNHRWRCPVTALIGQIIYLTDLKVNSRSNLPINQKSFTTTLMAHMEEVIMVVAVATEKEETVGTTE